MSYDQLLENLRRDLPQSTFTSGFWFWVAIAVAVLTFTGFLLWFFPKWNVWRSLKEGEAELAKAKNEQMVQISMAEGRLKAAEANKKAAIIEAEAVAAQIEKIGSNLKEHDLYLKWQWIRMMEERPEASTIYIPTEAGLPILEAGKRA